MKYSLRSLVSTAEQLLQAKGDRDHVNDTLMSVMNRLSQILKRSCTEIALRMEDNRLTDSEGRIRVETQSGPKMTHWTVSLDEQIVEETVAHDST